MHEQVLEIKKKIKQLRYYSIFSWALLFVPKFGIFLLLLVAGIIWFNEYKLQKELKKLKF